MREMATDSHTFILDMHEVIGVSESAARLLNRARLGFGDEGIAVVCSRIRDHQAVMGPLRKAVRKGDRGFLVFEDNDLSILMPLQNGAHQRVASLGPGMEFGEMAILGQTARSASVYADTEVRCRILEALEFGKITDAVPHLKIIVLENLAIDMANRLRGANKWIAALA